MTLVKGKRQLTWLETWEGHNGYKESCFPINTVGQWHRLPKKVVQFLSLEVSNPWMDEDLSRLVWPQSCPCCELKVKPKNSWGPSQSEWSYDPLICKQKFLIIWQNGSNAVMGIIASWFHLWLSDIFPVRVIRVSDLFLLFYIIQRSKQTQQLTTECINNNFLCCNNSLCGKDTFKRVHYLTLFFILLNMFTRPWAWKLWKHSLDFYLFHWSDMHLH